MYYEYEKSKIKLTLRKGQLVKFNTQNHDFIAYGEILEFLNYDIWAGGYVLKNLKGDRVILPEDRMFLTIPSKDEIRSLIDIALILKDKKWFEELVYILNNETNPSIKK